MFDDESSCFSKRPMSPYLIMVVCVVEALRVACSCNIARTFSAIIMETVHGRLVKFFNCL